MESELQILEKVEAILHEVASLLENLLLEKKSISHVRGWETRHKRRRALKTTVKK